MKTDFRASFEGLSQKIGAGGKEGGKINWQKSLQTLPETETSAPAGSVQTLTQPAHKLKLQGDFFSLLQCCEALLRPRLWTLTAASGRTDRSITSVPLAL